MERAKAAFSEPVFIGFPPKRLVHTGSSRDPKPARRASGIIVPSASGMRLRELGAVYRCISEPSKRGRNIAKDPQWSLGKYFGIELLSLLVEFLGRRDYGDPAHQLVDFVAANTGSDRDKVVLTQLKTTARSHMKNLAK